MYFLEGGVKNPVSVPYVAPGGDPPYQFTFHGKVYHSGKISSIKSGSDKDELSMTLSPDGKHADVSCDRNSASVS